MPQRVPVPAFADPSNTTDSVAQSVSRSVNEYLQVTAPGTARAPVVPMRTPGVVPFATWPQGPIRGLFQYDQPPQRAGHVYVVGGQTFGELFPDGTIGNTHTVYGVANPVSMCANGYGHQVFITSGDEAYIYDIISGAFTWLNGVPGLGHPIIWGEQFAGYFLALQGAGSRNVYFSKLFDGLHWQGMAGGVPLDQTLTRSWAPDEISRIIRSHTEIWFLGYRTSEVWVMDAATNTLNTFIPQQGVFVELGTYGTWSAQRIDNTIIWIGVDEMGHVVVYRADGYTPRRISTHAVETWLQRTTLATQAQTFVMQIRGHLFFHIFIPDAETTWVYDVTTSGLTGRNIWHEWSIYDPKTARYYPHVAVCHCDGFGMHLVGSRLDGTIYRCDPDLASDTITGTLT